MAVLLTEPMTWQQARDSIAVKTILPTMASSFQLSAISSQLRERSFFSAGNYYSDSLQDTRDWIDKLVQGETDPATVEVSIQQKLQELGYAPGEDIAGTIKDLTSDPRLRLVTTMNADFARGYGDWQSGQEQAILDQYPCQELFRLEKRKMPRDWIKRWEDNGGTLTKDGRMIAPKNDPIWIKISRFKLAYPPFDFGSGMWVRDIDRQESIALGVITEDTRIEPQTRDFNEALQATSAVRDQDIVDAILRENPDFQFADGVLSLKGAA